MLERITQLESQVQVMRGGEKKTKKKKRKFRKTKKSQLTKKQQQK